jgi:hypothetical protein
MAAISLFGNMSFFDLATQTWNSTFDNTTADAIAYNRLCSLVPFARLDPILPYHRDYRPGKFPACSASMPRAYDPKTMREYLSAWLHGFNDTQQATRAISIATFLVNEATLTMDKWLPKYTFGLSSRSTGGRTIYTGSGATIHKPKLSFAAIIIVSCVLLLEIVGLAILTWLIYRSPSEAPRLDVTTFTKLKEDMEQDLDEDTSKDVGVNSGSG